MYTHVRTHTRALYQPVLTPRSPAPLATRYVSTGEFDTDGLSSLMEGIGTKRCTGNFARCKLDNAVRVSVITVARLPLPCAPTPKSGHL